MCVWKGVENCWGDRERDGGTEAGTRWTPSEVAPDANEGKMRLTRRTMTCAGFTAGRLPAVNCSGQLFLIVFSISLCFTFFPFFIFRSFISLFHLCRLSFFPSFFLGFSHLLYFVSFGAFRPVFRTDILLYKIFSEYFTLSTNK